MLTKTKKKINHKNENMYNIFIRTQSTIELWYIIYTAWTHHVI